MTRNTAIKYWFSIPLFFIFGISLLIYGRTLGFEFLTWDDDFNIYQNPWIVDRNFYGLVAAPYSGLFVPVPYATWYGLFTWRECLLKFLQVDTVAWASGMRDLLSAFFSFYCIYIYIRYRNLRGWLVASGFFVLAILSKPSAIMLPFIVGFFETAVLANSPLKYRVLRLAPWVGVGLVLMRVAQGAQSKFLRRARI